MNAIQITILAVIQGVAEFLPISSSGHLVVANEVMEAVGKTPPADRVEVSIVLHLGTLVSVLIVYRQRILRLLTTDRRVIPLLIVGTIPAVVFGIPLRVYASPFLESSLVAGLMFPITGIMLVVAFRRPASQGSYTALSFQAAFVIGLFQAVALLPGVSRSGATIVAGLFMGLRREDSATFAFLLAIPAILGAGAFELIEILRRPDTISTSADVLVLGFTVSATVGLGALVWLIRLIQRGKFHYFAWWLVPLGLVVVAWRLISLAA